MQGIVFASLLVLANGFFVATEFALARLRPTQIADFLREGKPGAKSAKHAVQHIDSYLAACQLGITLASLGLGIVGEHAFRDLLEPLLGEQTRVGSISLAAALAFLIITLLHIVAGELAPKSLAIARTSRMALLLSPPMRIFYLLTKPPVDLFNGMGNLLLKPFGIPPASEAGHTPHSEDEIRELLRESHRQGLIERDEQEISDAALIFGDKRVREVMKPRSEIDLLYVEDDIQTAAEKVLQTGRTRLPLCEPHLSLDDPIGVINAKDLLRGYREDIDLRALARPFPKVSESTRIDEALRLLRQRHQHIALVLDQHATAVGLITMEDILEELVGEIEDEYDEAADEYIHSNAQGLLIAGNTPTRLVIEQLDLKIEEIHEATIGGYIVELLGRLPKRGEIVDIGNGQLIEVADIDGTQIVEVLAKQR